MVIVDLIGLEIALKGSKAISPVATRLPSSANRLAAGLDANANRRCLGVLVYVHPGGASNTCYLVIEHENENYTGSLVFDDGPFCRQIVDLLQRYCGRSVKEIGDLDVTCTL